MVLSRYISKYNINILETWNPLFMSKMMHKHTTICNQVVQKMYLPKYNTMGQIGMLNIFTKISVNCFSPMNLFIGEMEARCSGPTPITKIRQEIIIPCNNSDL